MRESFEQWVLTQFGKDIVNLLGRHGDDSYSNESINAMWIGFSAAAMIYQPLPKA